MLKFMIWGETSLFLETPICGHVGMWAGNFTNEFTTNQLLNGSVLRKFSVANLVHRENGCTLGMVGP